MLETEITKIQYVFCPVCPDFFACIKMLHAHCKFKHTICSSYPCKQKLCSRVYDSRRSFLKHLLTAHSQKDNIINDASHKKRSIKNIKYNPSVKIMNKSVDENVTDELMSASTSSVIHKSDAITAVDKLTPDEFADIVAMTSAQLVANLYARSSLPRSFCNDMIQLTKIVLSCVKHIEEKYMQLESNPDPDLSSMFRIIDNTFTGHSSEYQSIRYFKLLNTFIEPQEIRVGASIDSKVLKTGRQLCVRHRKICIVPLHKILQKFLELPDVYNKITTNIENIKKKETITSILHSKMWHSIELQYENVYYR